MFLLCGRTFIVSQDKFNRGQTHLLTHSNGVSSESEFFRMLYGLIASRSKVAAVFRGMHVNVKKCSRFIYQDKNFTDTDKFKLVMDIAHKDLVKFERQLLKSIQAKEVKATGKKLL